MLVISETVRIQTSASFFWWFEGDNRPIITLCEQLQCAMHNCYPWLLPECCIIFLRTELENSYLADSKTCRCNSSMWKVFSVCLGFFFILFFLERPNSIKGDRILSFEKKKALHNIWTGWKGSRGYWSIIVRLWKDLKCLNGSWREKNKLGWGVGGWGGEKWKAHDQPHLMCQSLLSIVMTGELLIKAELLVLIYVIAGKSRI